MYVLEINRGGTFKETVKNIEALKSQVVGILASFSCFDIKDEIIVRTRLRDMIYSLEFEEWKKERILEFIYNDIEFEVLEKLI